MMTASFNRVVSCLTPCRRAPLPLLLSLSPLILLLPLAPPPLFCLVQSAAFRATARLKTGLSDCTPHHQKVLTAHAQAHAHVNILFVRASFTLDPLYQE